MSILERLLYIPGHLTHRTTRRGATLAATKSAPTAGGERYPLAADRSDAEHGVVLVALTGTALDHELMALACVAARQARVGVVHALFGIAVPRVRAVDDEAPEERALAEAALARAATDAREFGLAVEGEYMQARDVGACLVRMAAAAHRCSLLILGASASAADEDASDDAGLAAYALRHAPCRVWVVRGGAPGVNR